MSLETHDVTNSGAVCGGMHLKHSFFSYSMLTYRVRNESTDALVFSVSSHQQKRRDMWDFFKFTFSPFLAINNTRLLGKNVALML